MKQKILFIFIIILMIMIILFPEISSEGTTEGLILWYNSVLPSLLPYMILTNILINTGVLDNLKSKDSFFSSNTFFSIFIGFLCGYPMGAYFVSKNYKAGNIKPSVAYWLLSFVNLSSPAFLIQFVVIKNLNGKYLIPMLISVYLSAIIIAFILLPFSYKNYKSDKSISSKKVETQYKDISECITDSFLQTLKLCGYIVLFSITVKMVTAHINTVTTKHIILIGILEQTNGINIAANIIGQSKTAAELMAMFTAFGSISCIFQTASVCKESNLKMLPYIISKLFQGILSFLIMHIIC